MKRDGTIETLFEEFDNSQSLPQDIRKLDSLVKSAVGELGYKPVKARKILKRVSPEDSANYLVGALDTSDYKDYKNGAMAKVTASEILKEYGAGEAAVKPLIAALKNPVQRGAAIEILKYYGPSKTTVEPLVGSLLSPKMELKEAVMEVLAFYVVFYGKKCLEYIRPCATSSNLYEPLRWLTKFSQDIHGID
jgi:hypothetical protein